MGFRNMCLKVVAKPMRNGRIMPAIITKSLPRPGSPMSLYSSDWMPQSKTEVLLLTLMAKVAVAAILATMLVRFPWFRRILLTERRGWPERLVFAAGFGLPLMAGVLARMFLGYNAADL